MNLRYQRKTEQTKTLANTALAIWHKDERLTDFEFPKNSLCLFRKKFTVEQMPKSASLSLFAHNCYIVYINGEKVGAGQNIDTFDVYDILSLLKQGENVLAAEVMYYSAKNNFIPCLCGEIAMSFNGGREEIISTDETFKVCLSTAFNRNAPLISGAKGCMEVWDMQEKEDFFNEDFDDSDWENTKATPILTRYSQRTIPYYKEKYVPARAVIAAGKGKTKKGYDVDLLHEQVKAEIDAVTLNHIYVLGSEGEFPPLDKDEFSYILVDFERIRTGRISIDVSGYAGDIVDVVYADELFDGKPKFDTALNRPISRFVLKDGQNNLTTDFDCETFRYAFLIFRNHIRISKLKEVAIFERHLNFENKSEFTIKNECLQKLWDMSVNTLNACVDDGFINCPVKKELNMSDARWQAQINYYLTGDETLHEKALKDFCKSHDSDLQNVLQWVCSFGDYYKFTGKTELIKDLWNEIIFGMRYISGFENENGLITEENNISALLNLMYAEACEKVAALSRIADDTETERFFLFKAGKLKKNIYVTLWNKEKGIYSDCMENGVLSNNISEHINAMALIVLHKKTDKRATEIIKNVFENKEEVLISKPNEMAIFYKALHKVKRDDIAFHETLGRYNKMLDKGATSVYEAWDITGPSQSACFGASAAPVLFVAQSIVGLDIFGKSPEIKPMNDCDDFSAKLVTSKGVFEIEK